MLSGYAQYEKTTVVGSMPHPQIYYTIVLAIFLDQKSQFF